MKDKRLLRARRLMDVQEQMRRVAEMDLAAARDETARIEADRAALMASLSTGAFGHLLLQAATRRLRGLATEATEAEAETERRAEALRERGLAEKRAESQVDRLARAHRFEMERRAAIDRLDTLGRPRGDASLP